MSSHALIFSCVRRVASIGGWRHANSAWESRPRGNHWVANDLGAIEVHQPLQSLSVVAVVCGLWSCEINGRQPRTHLCLVELSIIILKQVPWNNPLLIASNTVRSILQSNNYWDFDAWQGLFGTWSFVVWPVPGNMEFISLLSQFIPWENTKFRTRVLTK